MSHQHTDIPVITSLVVNNEPLDLTSHGRRKPMPPWQKPFLDVLDFLKIIDISRHAPKVDGQRFCFRPSHDLSNISRIFISVSTLLFQGDIDLRRIPPGPNGILPAVAELQEYADHVLLRIQRFRDRLVKSNIIQNSTGFLHVDLFTCPLCRDPLLSCFDCDAEVACFKPKCPASDLDMCKFCFDHRRMSCHACIGKKDMGSSLICCPVCDCWCCMEDMYWCPGLVKEPAPGTEELAKLSRESNWDSEIIVRSHPPKYGPCAFCMDHGNAKGWITCHNRGDETEPDRCPTQTRAITASGLRDAYCPDCISQSPGYLCACELGWLCETCYATRNKSRSYPYLITCPRCGVHYCTDPDAECMDYIEICRGCQGAILCNDCHEEEELPGETQPAKDRPEEIVFDGQCSYCLTWTCGDCRDSGRSPTCFFCEEWFCMGCLTDEVHVVIRPCPVCRVYVCTNCAKDHARCPGAVMLTGLRAQDDD